MNSKSALREALTAFVKQKAGVMNAVVCTVKSVDAAKKICVCVPVNGDALIPAVRLMQMQDKKGFLIVPKVQSPVVVCFLGDGSAYVAMFGEIDEVQLNGDKFGGLPQIQKMVDKYNALEDKVNAIIKAYNGHIHITTATIGLGSVGVIQTTTSTVAGELTKTAQKDLENIKVKHGDGT